MTCIWGKTWITTGVTMLCKHFTPAIVLLPFLCKAGNLSLRVFCARSKGYVFGAWRATLFLCLTSCFACNRVGWCGQPAPWQPCPASPFLQWVRSYLAALIQINKVSPHSLTKPNRLAYFILHYSFEWNKKGEGEEQNSSGHKFIYILFFLYLHLHLFI